jgi:hypothetical protein
MVYSSMVSGQERDPTTGVARMPKSGVRGQKAGYISEQTREDLLAGEELKDMIEIWNRLGDALPDNLAGDLDRVFMELGRARLQLKRKGL